MQTGLYAGKGHVSEDAVYGKKHTQETWGVAFQYVPYYNHVV